jgi:hypothetical protein
MYSMAEWPYLTRRKGLKLLLQYYTLDKKPVSYIQTKAKFLVYLYSKAVSDNPDASTLLQSKDLKPFYNHINETILDLTKDEI